MLAQQQFNPVDLQKLWNISPSDWGQLRERGLTHSKRKGTRKMPASYNIIQTALIGLQTALVREAKMSIPSANRLTEEVSGKIKTILESRESPLGKSVLYAVRAEPAQWMAVTADTTVGTIDTALGANLWLIVDVNHYVDTAWNAFAAKYPEFAANLAARRVGKNN